MIARGLSSLAVLAFLVSAAAAEEPAEGDEKTFSIKESELQRLPVPRMRAFPWAGQKKPAPEPPATTQGTAPTTGQETESLLDVSGDVIIAASGPFARLEEKRRGETEQLEAKEIFSLKKDVEIVQPATGSLLRGQDIKLVRDTASGNMERLEAHGNVEIVFGTRKARGEALTYETKFGPPVRTPAGMRQEVVVNIVVVEGDPKTRKPATLWSGDDAIQAQRFVLDMRRDTFRAMGGALIEVGLPAQPGEAPPLETPNKNAMFPGLSLTPGAKVFLSSDGDFLYEGFSGRIAMKRNVQAKQEGFLLVSDEMEIHLDLGPAGQTQRGVFAGSLQSLDCKGRIEVKTPSQVIHCDRLHYDLKGQRLRLEMVDPKSEVKTYFRDPQQPDKATKILQTLRRIDIDTRNMVMADTDKNAPPARTRTITFTGPIPNPRPSYKSQSDR